MDYQQFHMYKMNMSGLSIMYKDVDVDYLQCLCIKGERGCRLSTMLKYQGCH